MTDIVITIPRETWGDWLAHHGPGLQRGKLRTFHIYDHARGRPPSSAGDMLYVAAHGRLRCVFLIEQVHPLRGGWFIWATMTRSVTLKDHVPGFKGWRRRWWDVAAEEDFDAWRTEGVSEGAAA